MEFWLLIGGAVILYYAIKAMATSSKQQVQKNNRPSSENEIRVTMTTTNRVVASSNRDGDDDLATFNISYGYEEEKSKNKTPGNWIKSGEIITLNGQTFTGGNFYFGGKLSSLDGYGTEASLVDHSLKIENKPSSYEDESLGYFGLNLSHSHLKGVELSLAGYPAIEVIQRRLWVMCLFISMALKGALLLIQ